MSKAKDLIFTGRTLTAVEAENFGARRDSLQKLVMPILAFAGLVDYVSKEGTSAIDRALTLANDIAANGAFMIPR